MGLARFEACSASLKLLAGNEITPRRVSLASLAGVLWQGPRHGAVAFSDLRRVGWLLSLAQGAVALGCGSQIWLCRAAWKCRHAMQIDVKSRTMRKFIMAVNAEASLATGPGTTNQSNPPTPTLAGVFHS